MNYQENIEGEPTPLSVERNRPVDTSFEPEPESEPQSNPQPQSTGETKVTWEPTAEITITGLEFQSLVQLTELYEVPMAQIPLSTLNLLFIKARAAGKDILTRMREEGKLS